jgi:hypothetical protein
MSNKDDTFNLSGSMIKFISMLLGLAAAYFLTIQSLKVEVASKADYATVETIDKKLTNIEVILREGVLSKEQFYQFSKDMEKRLSRIEFLLEENTGDKFEKFKRP